MTVAGRMLTIAFLTACAVRPEAQQRAPFGARVELVEVDAVVTGERGKVVEGLRREDLEIREDSRPMEIKTLVAAARRTRS